MKSQTPVTLLHTDCLQADVALIPPGPGAFAVVLDVEVTIKSPFNTETICLPEGTPLLGIAQVEDLAEAAHRHLHGSLMDSDLRLGVALLLGHHPAEHVDDRGSARTNVDDWLGKNTAFIFWPQTGNPAVAGEDGLFAGIARSWATQNLQTTPV
ncbi:hypothetical protein BH09PSE1_BH09PSE1_15730 [soil metagenome]